MVKTILITGASSGIGAALAIEYAATGNILYLTGRSQSRLENVRKICERKGAQTIAVITDVKNREDIQRIISSIKNLDLVYANAGISSGTSSGDEEFSVVDDIFQTNVIGMLNTVYPALEQMKKKHAGQIVLISSLASYRGMAGSPAYSASKAAVRVYGEALRDLYYNDGIKINVVCPGFVKSGITDKNRFFMPFLMPAEKCASIIRKGVEKNKAIIAFPAIMAFLSWLIMSLPTALSSFITRRLPKK